MKPLQQSLFSALPAPRAASVLRRRASRPTLKRRTPLWVAIHLPQLPLQAILNGETESAPHAVIEAVQGAARIVIANSLAAGNGIAPGMTLASAWALLPSLTVHERDVTREQELLRRLASWVQRFTPVSCIDGQSVLLEVRGSLQLFGGVAALLEAIQAGMRQLGFSATLAAAPTPRAALWLARAGRQLHVDTLDALPGTLGELPIGVARFDPALQEKLRGVGVRRMRDLMRLPRDGLARRYSPRILRELDQALGRVPDVRRPLPLPQRFSARIDLLYEITETARLLHPLQQLLQELDAYLHVTQQGISRLRLHLHHRDDEVTSVVLGFAEATRDAERINDLVEQRLEAVTLPAPVLAIVLRAVELTPLAGKDRVLFPEQQGSDDWPRLVERLCTRLGSDAVHGLTQRPDHRPERAWHFTMPGIGQEHARIAQRPHWLLEEPRLLRARGGKPDFDGPLEILDGPERVETGWWDDNDVIRDYFVARSKHGQRVWICREVKTGRWWLQGIFD